MPKYLMSVVYTVDGAKGLRADGGTKREHVVRMALESVGGKLESFYFTLGETTRSSSPTCPTPRRQRP